MTLKMNELPEGFEDLPIGFIQALFEFYRTMENLNPSYNIGDIPINNIEPSMRAAIIRSDYIAFDIPEPNQNWKPSIFENRSIEQKLNPIKPSEIYNLGMNLGMDKKKVMDIIAGKYDGPTN